MGLVPAGEGRAGGGTPPQHEGPTEQQNVDNKEGPNRRPAAAEYQGSKRWIASHSRAGILAVNSCGEEGG